MKKITSISLTSPSLVHIFLTEPYCSECPQEMTEVWSLNHLSPPPLFAFLLPFFLLIPLTWKGQNKCSFGISFPSLPQHAWSTTQTWGIGIREELKYISLFIFFKFSRASSAGGWWEGDVCVSDVLEFSTVTLRVNGIFFLFPSFSPPLPILPA